jgi:hypothetical protein
VNTNRRVCVIGAGPSGIAAAKNLIDVGLTDLVVYDRGDRVGGNWVFDAESGHSSVFETTHLISSKCLSEYHDFPMPPSFPEYPHHSQLASYFSDYAEHFGLRPFIRFRTLIERCDRADDGTWTITGRNTATGEVFTDRADELVVANGHHWKPRYPSYPGTFAGEWSHSHGFKRADPYRGKRVLVIGGGNSACDAAVETARVAEYTDISMRRGYWIVPKFLFGLPVDELNLRSRRLVGWLPFRMRRWILERVVRLLQGPNSRYGLAEPDHRLLETHPTLNSELLYFLRHGDVGAKPDIARLDGHTVHFTDGTSRDYDAIICCTGFEISHPFLDPDLVDFSSGPVPLYLKMLPAHVPNLAFMGLFQPLGCIWPGAELQAKILARKLIGEWQPPVDLEAAIRRELASPDVPQIPTARHTITVEYLAFRERLLAQLGDDWHSPQRSPNAAVPISA